MVTVVWYSDGPNLFKYWAHFDSLSHTLNRPTLNRPTFFPLWMCGKEMYGSWGWPHDPLSCKIVLQHILYNLAYSNIQQEPAVVVDWLET